MPIRLVSNLGSQQEADAFVWAADHGADVISCSWGPRDGTGQVDVLPDSTRTAIDYAVNNGRNGLGCVITWAAGNGNESVDDDGYAAYPKVIAVGACNDRGKRSQYSDTGDAVWCSFPSNDIFPGQPRTQGIWTTDRRGSSGYSPTDYADDFGGTSSSCPGAAGVAAFVLARNPSLRWDQVKDILKRCCDRIDAAAGRYDSSGHSPLYGYGRLNAETAVTLATPATAVAQQTKLVRHTTEADIAIQDHQTSTMPVKVADSEPIQSARIRIDIEHTYRGDLFVKLLPPPATGVSAIALHSGAAAARTTCRSSTTRSTRHGWPSWRARRATEPGPSRSKTAPPGTPAGSSRSPSSSRSPAPRRARPAGRARSRAAGRASRARSWRGSTSDRPGMCVRWVSR